MDHIGQVKRKVNPRERANILSVVTFSYTARLFGKAFKKDLEEEDIYEVVKKCGAKKNGDNIEKRWLNLRRKNNTSIARLLWNCFGFHYLLLGAVHLTVKLFTTIMEPEALGKLVSYFNPKQTALTIKDAYYYAGVLIGLKFMNAFYFQNFIIVLQQLSIKIRTSICSLIYRKSLRLTPAAMNEISLGNVITVMTKDIMTLERSIRLFNEMWTELIRTVLVCYLIYNKMGIASAIGIGILFVVVPVQVYVGSVIKNMRLALNKLTDERLQATQETLSAIQIIKMYTWESIFTKKVSSKRANEMKLMMKSFFLKSMIVVAGIITSKIGFYCLIISYIYLNDLTSAEVIFYVMDCFKGLRHSIGILIPLGLGRGAELLASASRIKRVLDAPELDELDQTIHEKPNVRVCKCTVQIKDKDILKNINTVIKDGLTVVTGPLGCGKSALLKLFMKEYPVNEGEVISEASFSYSSQDPWLFPSSIKQNILFGEELDEKRYQRVVNACALDYDFSLLEKGDETIVADRGLNLSKGQQARINLARAVYKKSHIYLLDDPLSALDPNVQDSVFQNVVNGYLKGAICVLVTHNSRHIKSADNIIILDEGAIRFQGKQTDVAPDALKEVLSDENQETLEEEKEQEEPDESSKLVTQIAQRKVYSEVKKSGKVSMDVYIKYFKFGGGLFAMGAIVCLFLTAEFAETFSSRLLTDWINLQQNKTNLRTGNTTTNSSVYNKINDQASFTLNLYSGMILSSAILDVVRQYFFLNFARKASLNLHNTMINKLVTAVMPFYDKYFIGNILNRFSQDLNVVDEELPHTVSMFIMVLFSGFGIVVLVSSVSWTFLVPSSVLIILLVLLRTIYMPTVRSLKRLEAATRSPLVGHLNASMEGVTTIRAYKAQKILEYEFDRHQDLYTSAHYMIFCARRAFGFSMDILSAFFITAIILKLLFFDSEQVAGDVGLAITKASTLAHIVQWALMQWSELENDMTSVERVLEYTEVSQDNYDGQKIVNWPTQGTITYNGVTLSYGNEQVLKNVTFSVGSKQKIGIVGRTGAGKSSIISTLFRLYNFEGTIHIDGVNTKSVALSFLRHCISIIPQDPVLFQGTIKMNIDPYSEYTDEEIWNTIEKVKMRNNIPSLDLAITDHGSNFSTGQRQLICLARAIIRKNKIVVLDEATANMDPQTENLIQETIIENFSNCTVLIIAHRLQSVLDCNKILVLERGSIIEYDDPIVLSENKNSLFYQMLKRHEGFTS